MSKPTPERYVPPERLVDERGRRAMTGYSRQSWYRLEKEGKVPARITLGDNKVAWLESELLAWIKARAAARVRQTWEDQECAPGPAE